MRAYLTQKSNSLSESVNYEMGQWSWSALMNSWCYTITNGVRGISLWRRIFHNTPAPLSNASLVAKEPQRMRDRKRVGSRSRSLSFLSISSPRERPLLARKKTTMETRKWKPTGLISKKTTLNVQHTFRGRFRCRNRNDWGCQTWSERQCDRRIA